MKHSLGVSLVLVGLIGALRLSTCTAIPVLEAAQLPATVKIAIDPPTDSPSNYKTTLDGGVAVSQGLPVVTPACVDFFSGVSAPCLSFTFTVATAGVHTVTIIAESVGGDAAATSYSFNLTIPAPASRPRAIK